MTPIEFQIAFERELNVFYDGINKPTSDTTFYWINLAVMKFVKTRYTGTNYRQQSFEQDLKRIDDLRLLVKSVIIPTAEESEDTANVNIIEDLINNVYSATLPEDYLFLLGVRVGILPRTDIENNHLDCWSKDADGNYIARYADPIEVTIDTIDRQLENSLSEHNIHYCAAKPLKLVQGNNVIFYTDKYYKVSSVSLTYMKQPTAITLDEPFVDYKDLPEHACQEVVKLAVQMYLENTANQRYTTYTNEVISME